LESQIKLANLNDLIVEILHNQGDNNHPKWYVGSGCFVSKDLVLTALHTIVGSGKLLVRIHGKEVHSAVVLLQGNMDVDLALLKVSDVEVDVPPLRYGKVDRSAAKVVKDCWAVGFPQFIVSENESGKSNPPPSSAQVNGEIPTGEYLSQQLLTLLVNRDPRPQSWGSEWEGMSGAVVFSDGYIVIGVITEHHLAKGENALTIVPITALDGLSNAKAWWNLLGVDRQKFVSLPTRTSSSIAATFHIMEDDFIEMPSWTNQTEIHFSITNLSNNPLKLAKLILHVTERKAIEKVRLKKGGAFFQEFDLFADVSNSDEADLLKGTKTQFVLDSQGPQGSQAFHLALATPEGYLCTCQLHSRLDDLVSNEQLWIESKSFQVEYPIRSIEVLRARKGKKR
jgi:hypothetical protein